MYTLIIPICTAFDPLRDEPEMPTFARNQL